MKLGPVLGGVVLLALASYAPIRRATSGPQCENPKAWYNAYNETYFDNTLPTDTIVDYAEHTDGILASTKFESGRFHIAFNLKYSRSALVVHTFLFHEACHIESWEEEEMHGPLWKSCMRRIISRGAITEQMVDAYND